MSKKIIIQAENPNDEYVVISQIYANDGEWIEIGDKIFEIETSKAVLDIESIFSGYIDIKCKKGEEVKIGGCIAIIRNKKLSEKKEKRLEKDKETFKKINSKNKIKTSYSNKAKEIILQHGISNDIFAHKDFVKENDVLEYLELEGKNSHPEYSSVKSNTLNLPSETETVPLSANKIAEIQNLSAGQNKFISNLNVRVFLQDNFITNEKTNAFGSLTNSLTPVILISVCKALKKFKEFNAFFHNDSINLHKIVNLGYILDLGEGIKVVNLGDLENKNITAVAKTIFQKVIKYKQGHIGIKDIDGTTFTVSDLSSENVYSFFPLINKFQSAIMGIAGIDKKTNSFLLSLTFDHRVTEGRAGSLFLNYIKEEIEIELTQ